MNNLIDDVTKEEKEDLSVSFQASMLTITPLKASMLTITSLKVSMLTITPPMQFLGIQV
jgi:hypothetical protein